ncbi:MAG TPA: 2-dehydropantoate 2-reductase [Thermoplasmata archaeon]|nr:2-dehydropantoate 2-reductase [Thermoplasmata archaeon]
MASHYSLFEGKRLIFTIFGAGALGSLVGGKIASKFPVVLIGREEHLSAIKDRGLTISGKSEMRLYPHALIVNRREEADFKENWDCLLEKINFEEYDYHFVIVCVKSYQTKKITEDIKYIFKQTKPLNNNFVVSLQNGIENEKLICEKVDHRQVIGGITTEGVTFLKPGEIYHAGKGETILGPFTMKSKSLIEATRVLVKVFNQIGMKASFCDNIYGKIWTKAIINSSINPITAITGLENGYILKQKDLEILAKRACLEGVAVAEANMIDLACDNPWKEVKKVIQDTANNKSSMLQDILNGKRTEIDCICGVIIKYGRKENIEVPTQCMLHTLVKNIELANQLRKKRCP